MTKSTEDAFNLNYLILPVNPAPPLPPEGQVCLFISTDNHLYIKTSDGSTKPATTP